MYFIVRIIKIIWLVILSLLVFEIIVSFLDLSSNFQIINEIVNFLVTPFGENGKILGDRVSVSVIIALGVYGIVGFVIIEVLRVLFPYERKVINDVETEDVNKSENIVDSEEKDDVEK